MLFRSADLSTPILQEGGVPRSHRSCAPFRSLAPHADNAGPEHPQAEFKLYTQDDADTDMAADGEVDYSSDWDSDGDEDEDDEDDEDADSMLVDWDSHDTMTYDALVVLDSDSNADADAGLVAVAAV